MLSTERSRLVSDIRLQGTESSRRCFPVIAASRARTAAGPSIPVVQQRQVDWDVQARLATRYHCGIQPIPSEGRLDHQDRVLNRRVPDYLPRRLSEINNLQDLRSDDFRRGTTTFHLGHQRATAAQTTSHGFCENWFGPYPVSQLTAAPRQRHCSNLTRFPAAAAPYCLRSAHVCATSGWSRCAPRPDMGLSRLLFVQATTAG